MEVMNEDVKALKDRISELEAKIQQKESDFEQLLHKTNVQLQNIFNSSNDLIQVISPEGKILFVNQTWKYKLGYYDSEIHELKFIDIIHPDHRKESLEKLMRITAGSENEKLDTILIGKYGKNIYVSGFISCVTENTQPIEFRCIFYDVTEKARAESAQSLYYKVAQYTHQEIILDQLYQQIFNELSSHLQVRNFSIALQTEQGFDFPFRINASPQHIISIDEDLAAYTLERQKPLIVYQDGIRKITREEDLNDAIEFPKIWLGVPFAFDKNQGVMMMYSYQNQTTFNHKDLELLDFIAGIVALSLDRESNKEKIKLQSARLEAIFESSTHQIWSIDRDFRLTAFNHNFQRLIHHNFNIIPKIGDQITEYFVDYPREFRRFWELKYQETFAGKHLNFETKTETLSHDIIWQEIFINPIEKGTDEIEEISVIANDITEKKHSEIALKESEEKFRNIFESFQDIYFRCDLSGRISMVSPSVYEVLGFKPQEIIGEKIDEYFISKGNNQNLLKILYQKKNVKNFQGTVQTRSGQNIDFLCNIRLIRNPWESHGEIEGVARDITQLKKSNSELKKAKDLAERSLKIKERFLANMSHEIRTPMNGIIGMIDLIGTTSLNNEQSEYIRTIKKSSDTLMEILNDILDLSKIEAGKMKLRIKPVRLMDSFEKVYDLYSQAAYRNNTSLYYHVDEHLPDWVLTDETRLLQIISNLTSNAIKFSNKKGVIHINIKVLKETNQKCEFRVTVKDSGIGIHPDDQKKLFVSFNQLDSSNRKQYAGTGLGLAISKELVKSMGGEIGVVSTPGFGSTFWFTFIAKKTDPVKENNINREGNIQKKFVGKVPKILLVDDNDINRKVALQILEKSGCIVIPASSGFTAIDRIKSESFDLVFMDIQMPEMDGIETTQKIRALKVKNLPPIIAMTAYSMEEDKDRFIGQGMDDYLAKPIKSAQLIEKVRQWTHFKLKVVESSVFEEKTDDLVINQNTLNQLHKYGGKELIASVLEDFKEEAKVQIESIEHAARTSNYDEMKSLIHTIKGNAGTLGLEKLSKQSASIEKRLKENKFDKLSTELKKLTSYYHEFIDSYQNILKNE